MHTYSYPRVQPKAAPARVRSQPKHQTRHRKKLIITIILRKPNRREIR